MIKNGTKVIVLAIEDYPEEEGVVVDFFKYNNKIIYQIETEYTKGFEPYELTADQFVVVENKTDNIIFSDIDDYLNKTVVKKIDDNKYLVTESVFYVDREVITSQKIINLQKKYGYAQLLYLF